MEMSDSMPSSASLLAEDIFKPKAHEVEEKDSKYYLNWPMKVILARK